MDALTKTLHDFCLAKGATQTYWVAYSGGVDSHVLLHALARLRATYPFLLRAIHIHHGLSPQADTWAEHCAAVCQQLQVEFQEIKIDATAHRGQSPEEVAREGRYAAFTRVLAPGDFLLTAHHEDDQAETVLSQLLRGAGLKGLAAMPVSKPLKLGYLVRPLLPFTRQELLDYAEQHHLQWIEDESNVNPQLTRNFLRHEILPILKTRWPTVSRMIARSAAHCAEAQQLLDEVIALDLAYVQGEVRERLSVKKLTELSDIRQRHVLRAWLQACGFSLPSTVKLQDIQHTMLAARSDKMPCFKLKNGELRRYREVIYALPSLPVHDTTRIFSWDLQQALSIPAVGTLMATLQSDQPGLRTDVQNVSVRFRQGGEVIALPKRGRHTLNKLFQEWGVPPWLRDRVPLVFVGEELAVVVGFGVGTEFVGVSGKPSYSVACIEPCP